MQGPAVALLAAILALAGCADGARDQAGRRTGGRPGRPPILVGAAIDQSSFLRAVDGPALAAARIEAERINARGGVRGRRIVFDVRDTGLQRERTAAVARGLLDAGADLLWVSCDTGFAAPALQAGAEAGRLALSPCASTAPSGRTGALAFSLGNDARDEGEALARLAVRRGWRRAALVVDAEVPTAQAVCRGFARRFAQLGGRVVHREAFRAGDGRIAAIAARTRAARPAAIALCAVPGSDAPAFVARVRRAGAHTPILAPWSLDGSFWLPRDRRVADGIWVTTYASIYGDDPDPRVRRLLAQLRARGVRPLTGGFAAGAGALDALVAALRRTRGATDGPRLARALAGLRRQPTLAGRVTLTPRLHAVVGRSYRVIEVRRGRPRFAGLIAAPARR